MSPALIDKVAVRFRALSDPNRLLLLQHIVSGDRSVNELAVAAGLSLANTSKHLAQLCSAGFIARHKAGTKAIYTLASDTPRLLCDLVCRDVRSQVERDVATTSPREACRDEAAEHHAQRHEHEVVGQRATALEPAAHVAVGFDGLR